MGKFHLLIEEIFVNWQSSQAKKFLSKKYDKCVRMERELAVNNSLNNNSVFHLNRSLIRELTFIKNGNRTRFVRLIMKQGTIWIAVFF